MRLDPRRRFRDRLLVGMVSVTLLPLAGFAILAAFELDSFGHSTAAQAQGAILRDEQDRQQSSADSRGGLIDARVSAISTELSHLAESVKTSLAAQTATTVPDTLAAYGGTQYSGGISDPESLVVAAAAGPVQAKLAAAADTVVPAMQTLRHDYPEIDTVWIANTASEALAAVPGFDVKGALDEGLLDPANPQLRDGKPVFGSGETRLTSPRSGQWVNPTSGRNPGAPYWTDAYGVMSSGNSGVSAWISLPDGQTIVGVDVSAASLVTAALTQPNATPFPPAAYPLVLSSDGTVVFADPAAVKDFPTAGVLEGAHLNLPKSQRFTTGLAASLASGKPARLSATLGGVMKDVFTAPVYGPQWVLATPVPRGDLEPDLTGLSYGIAQGVHALFPVVVLPALFFLLALAFVVATLLSRRLVGPVHDLTRAAEVLAEGHTEIPVPPQGQDEVGVLAGALERMRQEINGSHSAILAASAELELRVEQRTAELRSRNDELVALNDLAASLTRSLQTQAILTDAIEAIRAVQPLRTARGYVLDGETLVTVSEWCHPEVDDPPPAGVLDALAASAIARGRSVRRHSTDRSLLLAWPLSSNQGPLGAVTVQTRVAPKHDTQRLLQAITDQVALALYTAHLSAVGREHAVLEERTRLAREIHDTLAQQLTGIVLQLEAAQTMIDRGSNKAKGSVTLAYDLAKSALQEARRSVWNLRPASLAATGVVGAIEREVAAFGVRTGIAAHFRSRSVPRRVALSPAAEVALLRIVQEALNNVARHSGAAHVDVVMRTQRHELFVSVRDDGDGFDAETVPARTDCFGLQGMRERVRLVGGSLVVVSALGAGTEVTARMPLAEPAEVEHTA
ncbi:MAG: HAMP domain-containing protein [Candidatus Dormibacteraeota bacterium]|nr:HAMP domain-containing protein [Candidatus Dormibacteraeota bacterium]